MKALLQAGLSGQVPAPPEKRFLISSLDMVALVTVIHSGATRLSQVSTRTGMFVLPVRVKANAPEASICGGEVVLKAGFQRSWG